MSNFRRVRRRWEIFFFGLGKWEGFWVGEEEEGVGFVF